MRKTILLGTVATMLLAGPALAGGFTFGFGWQGRNGSFGFGISRERHHPAPPPPRIWIPGHYEERTTYVTIPGTWRSQWVPPITETRRCWGGWQTIVVRAGYWRQVWVPSRTIPQTTRVWVPGHWE
jgi:hypothetical protein